MNRTAFSILAVAALASVPGAAAHFAEAEEAAHGSVGFSATPTGPTTTRLDTCTFYVLGEGLPMPEASYHVRVDMGERAGHLTLAEGSATGEPDGEGAYSYVIGPITLEHSAREVYATLSGINETTDWHGKRSPYVEISCPHDPLYDCGDGDTVMAAANDDGSVTLTWETPELGADRYFVYWTSPFETVRRVDLPADAPTWTHEDTEPGKTYQYMVVAERDTPMGERRADCGHAEVTAVPFFGAPLLGLLALVGGVGAYRALRRP